MARCDLERAVTTGVRLAVKSHSVEMYEYLSRFSKNTNIRTITHLRDLFGVQVGLSDLHGRRCGGCLVALGATVVEKHFTLRRADGGVDSAFSLEPEDCIFGLRLRMLGRLSVMCVGPLKPNRKVLCFVVRCVAVILLKVMFYRGACELGPGHGAPPWMLGQLLGRIARRNYSVGTALSLDQLL